MSLSARRLKAAARRAAPHLQSFPPNSVQQPVQTKAPGPALAASTAAKQRRFEDLIAWRKARLLTREIYRLSSLGVFAADPELVRGIRAAAVAAMTALAEGFERRNPNDFYAFTRQARAACAAVRSQLYVAQDAGYLSEDELTFLVDLSEAVLDAIGDLQTVIARRLA